MIRLPIYADFQFRQVLPFPFILITLSSLAIPTKSFLFSPFSFYEGIQDLDSMARNIQYFHPERETPVSSRSWAPQSSSPSLGSFLGHRSPTSVGAFLSLLPVLTQENFSSPFLFSPYPLFSFSCLTVLILLTGM